MRDRSHYLHDHSEADKVHADIIRKRRAAQLPKVDDDARSMPWLDLGTHKGVPIRDLPTAYLRWVRDEFLEPWPSQRPAVAAALAELASREQQPGEQA